MSPKQQAHTTDNAADAKTKRRIEGLLKHENPGVAKNICRKLCRKNRADPHAWLLMSAIHAQLGEFHDAERCCREVINLMPNFTIAHYNRAISLQQLNRPEEAVKCLHEALRIQPDFISAYILLGDILKITKDFSKACDAYNEAIKLNPHAVQLFLKLSAVYKESGNLDEAEKALATALGMEPKNINIVLGMAQLQLTKERYAEAIDTYRAALNIDSNCREAYEKIAYIQLCQGNADAAIETYRNITLLAPGDISNWVLMAKLAASQGVLARAEEICRQGLKINPDNTTLLCELGKIMSEQGETKEAAQLFHKAKESQPDNEEISYLIAGVEPGNALHTEKQAHITKVFDDYADSFDTHLAKRLEYYIPELIQQLVVETITERQNKLDILDLGCGTGLCGTLLKDISNRLVGIDLSSKMLEEARQRGIYDELIQADIMDFLERAGNTYDLIIAADVFIYVGNLAAVFSGCKKVLREDGILVFSVETVEGNSYSLRASGRYGHANSYIHEMAAANNLEISIIRDTSIRTEGTEPIAGQVAMLRHMKI